MKANTDSIAPLTRSQYGIYAECVSNTAANYGTAQAGFEWGGDWTSCKDFQHFELIEGE